jgi:tetratricopeptide (TPR) repeat protein
MRISARSRSRLACEESFMMRNRLWLVVSLFFIVSTNLRADEWPVPRGASREPLPYRYDAKVLKTIPKEFLDDSTACILYSGNTHLVEPDGTVEAISHEITRLNSRKGIEKLGEFRSITFDPSYEKLTLNEARIIKANGKIVPIEPKHVQLRDVATDFQVYEQDKQLVISFPNLEVGDAYEVKWTVRGKNREFDGHFFTRYTFGDDHHPVLLDEFRVRAPKNKTLKYATVNGKADPVITDVGGEKLYHWVVRNRAELPKDEDRPSKEELRLQVAVSTFSSWEEVGKWKQKLRAECWTCAPEVRKTVDEVTRGLKTPVEKAKALTYWVRRHVRYHSRGPGGMGYTPHLPHQVLANLYGDCKDQAQLLAVMLREIGLPVWLVTLGTTDDGQVMPEVPSPWGSHAILLTEIDGKDYWIDTTVSLAAWDFLPRSDRDRQTYVTRNGELKLMKTPPFTYKDYRIEQTTYVTILPDGTSRCKREASYHHSSGWTKRDRWLEVPPGERRRVIIAELQDAHSKAKLLSLKIDEKQLLEFDRPARVELEFEVPKHFTGETTREGSLSDSPIWTWFLGYNLDVERRLPYLLPTQFESIHRYVVQLPDAYRLESMPENHDVKSAWGFFKLKVMANKDDPRRFELHMHMRLEKNRVEKAEFAEFLHFQDEVSRAYRVWVNLRPTASIADAPKLEILLADKELVDSTSVKILAKLYLDYDRTEDARRVLAKASPLFPDDKALWELRVQASANVEDEERLYRAMVKQFPQDPKYAVALGAACVRREDHAEAKKTLMPLTTHALAPVRAAAHYQLARSEYRQKNTEQALKHVQAALRIDSSALATVDALHFKARVHEKLGQIKDAIESLEAAIDADPSARDALEYLVRLEIQASKREAALEHLRRYTVAAGKDLSSVVKAADLHLELNRYEEAFDLATRARELGFQAKTQRILGLVHLARQEYAQAAFHLDRCDVDAKAIAGLIQAYVRLGDLDAAQRRAETIRKLDGPSKELRALEQDVASLVQRRDKLLVQWNAPKEQQATATRVVSRYVCAERGVAERWPREQLERLIEAASGEGLKYAPLLALRGWLTLEKGQLRKALADADAAIKLQPTEARAFLVRGRVRLEQGKGMASLNDLRKATELSKSADALVLHWFAAALLDAGRTKEAVETQRLALLLRPDDVELRDQLRRMEIEKSKESARGND